MVWTPKWGLYLQKNWKNPRALQSEAESAWDLKHHSHPHGLALNTKSFMWRLRSSIWGCLTATPTSFQHFRNRIRNNDNTTHQGPSNCRISGFLLANKRRRRFLSQYSHFDIFLGWIRYNPQQLLSERENNANVRTLYGEIYSFVPWIAASSNILFRLSPLWVFPISNPEEISRCEEIWLQPRDNRLSTNLDIDILE